MSSTPKILLVNNIPTHHQMPFAKSMYDICGENFKVAFLEPVDEERLSMGWQDFGNNLPWVIRVWESDETRLEFENWIYESDVAIFPTYFYYGSMDRIISRLKFNKLCFSFGERRWKPSANFWSPISIQNIPYHIYRHPKIIKNSQIVNHKYHHFLAIGTYAAWDEMIIGMFPNRKWKWAYFVENSSNDGTKNINDPIQILWAGRMLDWKNVDVLINSLSILRKNNMPFVAKIIGDGPMKNSLLELANKLQLDNLVEFLPFGKPEEIRREMAKSDIFIYPSSYEEGWGAAVNEAMGEGCVVISSNGVGAANVLLKNNANGFIFQNGDYKSLALIIEKLIKDPERIITVGQEAKKHIQNLWSPDIAAKRFVEFSSGLLGLSKMPVFEEGHLSRAAIIRPKRRFL
ncbi:MAG: glycosyltransferase family 4 protein [Armatimonadota bacterium]